MNLALLTACSHDMMIVDSDAGANLVRRSFSKTTTTRKDHHVL